MSAFKICAQKLPWFKGPVAKLLLTKMYKERNNVNIVGNAQELLLLCPQLLHQWSPVDVKLCTHAMHEQKKLDEQHDEEWKSRRKNMRSTFFSNSLLNVWLSTAVFKVQSVKNKARKLRIEERVKADLFKIQTVTKNLRTGAWLPNATVRQSVICNDAPKSHVHVLVIIHTVRF